MAENVSEFAHGDDFIETLLQEDPQIRAGFDERQDAMEGIQLLRDLLERCGKSRSELAKAMGVSPARITQALRGEQRDGPSYGFIKRFARACGFEWSGGHPVTVTPSDSAAAGEGGHETRVPSAAAIVEDWEDAFERARSVEVFVQDIVAALRASQADRKPRTAETPGGQANTERAVYQTVGGEGVVIVKNSHLLSGKQSYVVKFKNNMPFGQFVTLQDHDSDETVPVFMLPLTRRYAAKGDN